jgi:hypothetical protein
MAAYEHKESLANISLDIGKKRFLKKMSDTGNIKKLPDPEFENWGPPKKIL